MEEAKRLRDQGIQYKQIKPGEQINVDLKNATKIKCPCGCEYFTTAVTLYKVSALVSPTGQELIAQQPVLICNGCKEVLK